MTTIQNQTPTFTHILQLSYNLKIDIYEDIIRLEEDDMIIDKRTYSLDQLTPGILQQITHRFASYRSRCFEEQDQDQEQEPITAFQSTDLGRVEIIAEDLQLQYRDGFNYVDVNIEMEFQAPADTQFLHDYTDSSYTHVSIDELITDSFTLAAPYTRLFVQTEQTEQTNQVLTIERLRAPENVVYTVHTQFGYVLK